MPRSITLQPTDRKPAVAAWANIAPLVRASRPSTTEAWPAPRAHAPSAAACRATSSGVRSLPTIPRMPETEIIRVLDMAEKLDGRRVGRYDGKPAGHSPPYCPTSHRDGQLLGI